MNAPLNASLLTNPQLIAGETPGTYRVNGDVTDAQLLHLAKMIAHKRLRKGNKLGSLMKFIAACKPYCSTTPMKYLVRCY